MDLVKDSTRKVRLKKRIHYRGREEDKKKAIVLRNLITPPKTKLPKSLHIIVISHVVEGIITTVETIKVRDGADIDLFICIISLYRLSLDTPASIAQEKPRKPHQLIFFCHGGGWIMANRWGNEPILCEYALKTNSIVVYVNYRLAPEYTHPTAVYDCYDSLLVRAFIGISTSISLIIKMLSILMKTVLFY